MGEYHIKTADAYNNLADVFKLQNQLELSKSYFQKSLHIRSELLGTTHTSVGEASYNLALLM